VKATEVDYIERVKKELEEFGVGEEYRRRVIQHQRRMFARVGSLMPYGNDIIAFVFYVPRDKLDEILSSRAALAALYEHPFIAVRFRKTEGHLTSSEVRIQPWAMFGAVPRSVWEDAEYLKNDVFMVRNPKELLNVLKNLCEGRVVAPPVFLEGLEDYLAFVPVSVKTERMTLAGVASFAVDDWSRALKEAAKLGVMNFAKMVGERMEEILEVLAENLAGPEDRLMKMAVALFNLEYSRELGVRALDMAPGFMFLCRPQPIRSPSTGEVPSGETEVPA